MKSRFSLEETVREARARTGVPGVAAALAIGAETSFAAEGVLAHGARDRVRVDTPFRIASISKSFTALLTAETVGLTAETRAWLSHTAGLRCESAARLPAGCEGLWSYSNAGYWRAGEAAAESAAMPFAEAMRTVVLDPLGLGATGYDEPPRCARGHVQAGKTGHRAVLVDAYAVERRPSGGLWSTVADLVVYGRAHLRGHAELHEPAVDALGGGYALGWWNRPLADGTTAIEHEGSVGGYQTILLLVPERELVLAVLTNSWRGSGLIRRVVRDLGLVPEGGFTDGGSEAVPGRYELDGSFAVVEARAGRVRLSETGTDPVTGARIELAPYQLDRLGGGVYGFAGGLLMTHRVDFPRADVVRVGWAALPRIAS